MTLVVSLLLLYGIFSECAQNSDCGGATGVCNVTIGGKKYCSKCDGARVPVNGDCRLLSLSRSICIVPTDSTPTPGSCSGCIRDFLFYRGGCYRTASLINAICKEKHIVEEGMYCGACAIEGDVPIDGVCVAASADSSGNTCDKGVCTTCGNGYFFHYGSCYKFGGSPGANICSDSTSTTGSVCGSCGSKFVKNPSAGPSATSCFACYGLDGTLFCERCRMNVLTSTDVKPTLCTKCKSGHIPLDGRCISAFSAASALAGCSTYKGSDNAMGLCETCSSGYMLFYGSCYSVNGPLAQAICKTENQIYLGGRVFCKQCAQTDHYPINGLCIADKGSHTCEAGICTACDTSTTPVDNSKVFPFYNGCYDANSAIGKLICQEASNGACSTCNTNETSNIIANPNSADGQPKCLGCWDEAATGVANCGGCATGTDGDSKIVCSKCTDSTEPKDNTCPQALPPTTPEGCAVQGCQACSKDSATTCDTCFSPLVMKEDKTKCFGSCLALGLGYYNDAGVCRPCTSKCLTCTDGTTCTQCAEGYYLEVSGAGSTTGTCKACAAGCSTCTGAGDSLCSTCVTGYYAAFNVRQGGPGKCVQCSVSEDGYTGVEHCAACYSTTGQTTGAKNVVCESCEDGYLKEHVDNKVVCNPPAPKCTVPLCAICVENDAMRCEHCTTGAYLCPRTAACTKDCASCGGSMYPDEDLGECQPCDITNCLVCATGLKCESCAENAVPISPDVYHTACMGCSDTGGMDGWVGLAGCTTCELTDKGGGSVNCLDPGYYRRGGLGGGAIAAIVIVVLLVLAVAGFLVWWFVFRRGGRPKRGAKYTSLMRGESYDYRQSLI
ncbi:High cysteine membrane protein Group 3 [Giardia duodenalis]|uniref:High cysteine membrane protein Group 3 n=1 Tax=Giardia intestinalis (strain ATCC 50803 / WB clone C6) TaxID=184922 RepID=A8BGA3_GIAIC|nr:High cysteine membrane protein Group 3 [Giardia intestinalis]KAE8302202.1 High cysteine membrane protein Group 3 [Giardia intestinalis]|eukprot:XP_001707153.1 High cysteine membrane protein Group 3 [Giardia lamblia ATCC 50803]